MNLVQLQEHLKEMPLRAVMAYANGMNPQVPPYLALGELNRRKMMEQKSAPAKAPTETVKDQVEQQVGLMSLMKGRQNQMAQQSAMQSANAPMVPAGVPQPEAQAEPEYEGGGIADLPAEAPSYGYGGIVAFAEGGDKGKKQDDEYETQYDRMNRLANESGERFGGSGRPESDIQPPKLKNVEFDEDGLPRSKSEMAQVEAENEAIMRAAQNAAALRNRPLVSQQPISPEAVARLQEYYKPRVPQGPITQTAGAAPVAQPQSQVTPQQRAAAQAVLAQLNQPQAPQIPSQPATPPSIPVQGRPAPAAGIPGAAAAKPGVGGSFMDVLRAAATGQNAPQLPDYAAARAAAEARDPYLTKQPGSVVEEYLKGQVQKQQERRSQFEQAEKEQAKRDFFQSLIAAGEATRGRSGLGALLGGYGRSAGEFENLTRGRKEKFEESMAARDEALMKMNQEIENARIARSEGRFKDEISHREKAAEFQQKAGEIASRAAGTGAEIQSRERTAGMPGAEERMFGQFASAWLAKPENRGKTMADAYVAYKSAGLTAKEPINRIQMIEKYANDWNKMDPMERSNLKKQGITTREQYINDMLRLSGLGQAGGEAGPKEGDVSKSKSGKPIIFRNGQWEYS